MHSLSRRRWSGCAIPRRRSRSEFVRASNAWPDVTFSLNTPVYLDMPKEGQRDRRNETGREAVPWKDREIRIGKEREDRRTKMNNE